MVLKASGIVNALPHISIPIGVPKVSKKPTALPKRMLIGLGSDLLELIAHPDQAAIIPLKKECRI